MSPTGPTGLLSGTGTIERVPAGGHRPPAGSPNGTGAYTGPRRADPPPARPPGPNGTAGPAGSAGPPGGTARPAAGEFRAGGRQERARLAWQAALGALRRYAEATGGSYPPAGLRTPDGRKLAVWTSNARYAYRRGRLSPERVAELERIPGWEWRRHQAPRRRLGTGLRCWDLGYPRLRAWFAAHRSPPPVAATDPDGYHIGRFARNCRQYADRLTAAQRAALSRLPNWTWNVAAERDRAARDLIEGCRAFVNRHLHLPQRDAADPGERELAAFLAAPHSAHAHAIAEIRRAAVTDAWYRRYRQAAAGENGKAVVEWMSRQRAAARQGHLGEPQATLFDRLDGLHERRWRSRAQELRSTLVAGRRPSPTQVGWLHRQRARARRGGLTDHRAGEVEELYRMHRRHVLSHAEQRGPVACQAPGCHRMIRVAPRGRIPRYCGPGCWRRAQRSRA